jgi:hypothetical protein
MVTISTVAQFGLGYVLGRHHFQANSSGLRFTAMQWRPSRTGQGLNTDPGVAPERARNRGSLTISRGGSKSRLNWARAPHGRAGDDLLSSRSRSGRYRTSRCSPAAATSCHRLPDGNDHGQSRSKACNGSGPNCGNVRQPGCLSHLKSGSSIAHLAMTALFTTLTAPHLP